MLHLATSALSLVLLQAAPPAARPTTAAAPQPVAQPVQPAQPAPTTPTAQPVQPVQPQPTDTAAPPQPTTQPTTQPYPPSYPQGYDTAPPPQEPTYPYYVLPTAAQPPPTPTQPTQPQPDLSQRFSTKKPEPEPALTQDITHRRLVFANFYSVNISVLSIVPSGNVSFFFGTNLRPRRSGSGAFDWNTALGYQLTLSVGGSDMPTIELSDIPPAAPGVFIHRHHLTALGYGGKKQRLFYSFGGGGWFNLSQLAGIEAEGRLGYVFAAPASRRLKGVVGGQARLTGAFEGLPLLQIGPFIGLMIF